MVKIDDRTPSFWQPSLDPSGPGTAGAGSGLGADEIARLKKEPAFLPALANTLDYITKPTSWEGFMGSGLAVGSGGSGCEGSRKCMEDYAKRLLNGNGPSPKAGDSALAGGGLLGGFGNPVENLSKMARELAVPFFPNPFPYPEAQGGMAPTNLALSSGEGSGGDVDESGPVTAKDREAARSKLSGPGGSGYSESEASGLLEKIEAKSGGNKTKFDRLVETLPKRGLTTEERKLPADQQAEIKSSQERELAEWMGQNLHGLSAEEAGKAAEAATSTRVDGKEADKKESFVEVAHAAGDYNTEGEPLYTIQKKSGDAANKLNGLAKLLRRGDEWFGVTGDNKIKKLEGVSVDGNRIYLTRGEKRSAAIQGLSDLESRVAMAAGERARTSIAAEKSVLAVKSEQKGKFRSLLEAGIPPELKEKVKLVETDRGFKLEIEGLKQAEKETLISSLMISGRPTAINVGAQFLKAGGMDLYVGNDFIDLSGDPAQSILKSLGKVEAAATPPLSPTPYVVGAAITFGAEKAAAAEAAAAPTQGPRAAPRQDRLAAPRQDSAASVQTAPLPTRS